MSERIQLRYTVALQGFSPFERDALASFFRLVEQRAPAYVQVDTLANSDFIIADADHAASVDAIRQADRVEDTVFVGSKAPAGAACLARPIEPTHIVRELDLLLEQRLASLDEPRAADAGATDPSFVDNGKDVLVVDDSRIALRFLQMRLQALGYRVHLARDASQALKQLATQAFRLVFLDATLGPAGTPDGFALCQHIKRRSSHPGGVTPGIVMVTALSGSADRVRGALAGCDDYLTKPVVDEEFMRTLRRLDPELART